MITNNRKKVTFILFWISFIFPVWLAVTSILLGIGLFSKGVKISSSDRIFFIVLFIFTNILIISSFVMQPLCWIYMYNSNRKIFNAILALCFFSFVLPIYPILAIVLIVLDKKSGVIEKVDNNIAKVDNNLSKSDTSILRKIAYGFMIFSTSISGLLLIPLIWMIPLLLKVKQKVAHPFEDATVLGILCLFYGNFVTGLLLIIDSKDKNIVNIQ